MKRTSFDLFCLFLFIFGVVAFAAAPGSPPDPTTFASVVRVDITPSNNGFPRMFLAGFMGRANTPAIGCLPDQPPLSASAIAIQNGCGIKIIVAADILGFTHKLRQQILTEVSQRYGISKQNIMLSASHTHNGPVLTDNLDPKVTYEGFSADGLVGSSDLVIIDNYTLWLKDVIVNIIGTALNGLSTAPPVTLSYGVGTTNFAVNRVGIGNVDNDVPVLAVRSASDDSLVAVVFGYACHPLRTGSTATYYYHPDYPGIARQIVEQQNGGMAFFIQGAGADINPNTNIAPFVEDEGGMLASAVQWVLTAPGILQPVTGPILTESRDVALPLNMDPTDAEHQSLRAKYVTLQNCPGLLSNFVRHANQMIDQIDHGMLPELEPWPLQVFHFGTTNKLVLVALGGEPVSGYSLYLKNHLGSQFGNKLWVAGYCNEVPGYIPSNEVWDLPFSGGAYYEAGWACGTDFCDPLISSFGASQMYYGWPAPLKRGNIDKGGSVKGMEELVIENTMSLIQNPPSSPECATQPVDHLVIVSSSLVSFDRRTGQFSTNVTVTNTSSTMIGSPVWLVIASISSAGVTLSGSDGTTADGKKYIDLSGLLGDGKLSSGETINKRVYFNNPSRLKFTFVPSVRGVILP